MNSAESENNDVGTGFYGNVITDDFGPEYCEEYLHNAQSQHHETVKHLKCDRYAGLGP